MCDHDAYGHRGSYEQEKFRTKPLADAALLPRFRVPGACQTVVGNGSAALGSPFDPCAFGAVGPPYLPRCAPGVDPGLGWCEPRSWTVGANVHAADHAELRRNQQRCRRRIAMIC